MEEFDRDHPIVLGFVGGYATGKTATAEMIAPLARHGSGLDVDTGVAWEHLYFAMPLKRLARIREDIEGESVSDRIRYEVHACLVDIFGDSPIYGAPSYSRLIELVEEISTMPFSFGNKPRSFYQYVGTDLLRAHDQDVLVKWMKRKISSIHRDFIVDQMQENDSETPPFGVILSDCRFTNEAKLVRDHPNGILLKFWSTPEKAMERQEERDGVAMSIDEINHASETELADIPSEWFDESIDTTNITLEEQREIVSNIVNQKTGVQLANS